MAQAFIGFGGNIGDARQSITDAIVCLAQHVQIHIVNKSCFYQSAPVNAVGDDYINAVVEIDTELNPYGLLYVCQSIEHQFGRERPYANAPRTLDLDILFYEGIEQNHSELTIPHPRIAERSFVILPLLEICPDFFLPNHGPLKNLLPNIAHQRITRITCKHCDCGQQLH